MKGDVVENTLIDQSRPWAALKEEFPVRQFRLQVVEGAQTETSWISTGDRCAIGSHPSNDLVLEDRTVSRFHCEIRLEQGRSRILDLGSRNGTSVDGVDVTDAWLRDESVIRIGQSVIQFRFFEDKKVNVLTSPHTNFGTLVGSSFPMRVAFSLLERAAGADSTVLIEGETGTGKEEAALSIHESSSRRDKPFIIVDCSAIQPNLLESELFGHERGSFTGAIARRVGAFESAHGGTVFLDEIGELSADLQPRLLRVLERRTIRAVGSNTHKEVDVRIIAATNRNLRADVNQGTFRSDLYYRLAVIRVSLPPLRNRLEDILQLSDVILKKLGATDEQISKLLTPDFLARLQRAAWPGNVRELRNYLEQCLVLRDIPPLSETSEVEPTSSPPPPIDVRLSYAEARRRSLEDFERRYVRELLRHHNGNVSQAARAAEMNRVYFHRLLRRHGGPEM